MIRGAEQRAHGWRFDRTSTRACEHPADVSSHVPSKQTYSTSGAPVPEPSRRPILQRAALAPYPRPSGESLASLSRELCPSSASVLALALTLHHPPPPDIPHAHTYPQRKHRAHSIPRPINPREARRHAADGLLGTEMREHRTLGSGRLAGAGGGVELGRGEGVGREAVAERGGGGVRCGLRGRG